MITGLSSCYFSMVEAASRNRKLLAVLVDPEKFDENRSLEFLNNIPSQTSHIFVGGSTVPKDRTCEVVKKLRECSNLPVIIFPGDHSQITPHADALLFLSLISGRNPEYLIEQQVRSVRRIKETQLEIIPTGYILIDGGKNCSVHKVSNTQPLSQDDIETIVNTALAGQYSGKKLIYLEAGSGAKKPVSPAIIRSVKEALDIPLVVGGGIRSTQTLDQAYQAGADLVVIGTAFENGSFKT